MRANVRILSLILALTMLLGLTACGSSSANAPATEAPADLTGVADGVLTVGMECAYAPTTGPRWTTAMALFPLSMTLASMPTATM